MTPRRIRRRRSRNWQAPANTVYVGRGSGWANPFVYRKLGEGRYGFFTVGDAPGELLPEEDLGTVGTEKEARAKLVTFYEALLTGAGPDTWKALETELAGKNLSCWCPLHRPCHTDVLLKYANRPRQRGTADALTLRRAVRDAEATGETEPGADG